MPTHSRNFAALLALLFSLIGFTASSALAQAPAGTPAPLEGARAEISQIEAALKRDTLDDARLNELRERLDPAYGQIEEIIKRFSPQLDEIKARLEKLGPAPDASKGQSEADEVAKERKEQTDRLKEADESLKVARALALRAEQAKSALAERRRQNFSREILGQSTSILSPVLWYDAARALPAEVRAANVLLMQWGEVILANVTWLKALVLVGMVACVAVFWPFLRTWVRVGTFIVINASEEIEPTRLSKALVALRRVLLLAALPIVFFLLLQTLLDGFGFVFPRAEPVLHAMIGGLALVFSVSGLAIGLLAPNHPRERLAALPDRMAKDVWHLLRTLAILIAAGELLSAFLAAIVAAKPVSVAAKGLFATLAALTLAAGLRRIFRPHPENDPLHAAALASLLPVRLLGWGIVVLVLGAVVTGYVSFASFLLDQVLLLTILGLLMLLAIAFIEEFIGNGLSSKGGFGRRVREATGLTANSLDQISVLASGLVRLLLYLVLGMLALAPWGIDSSSLVGNLKAAFFGFTVGGVTISLSSIALAVAFFALGLMATRAVQSWLDTRYLPHTSLDVGLRNSIRTIFGYIGTFVAVMVALSQIGLSMEKITLVAGALSVGIGFGLKSIVENFVSGLILLWERPIRVGDWIVVGSEQGKVRRINVRSTEIETFDRASLIIPNAEFISGRVKNWTHADHLARIIIPLTVDTTCDPAQVSALLKEAAMAHREVLSEPGPSVIFKNLGENGMEFELRCFVDVDALGPTRSELLFDIVARLREAKIEVPTPTRRLEITNLSAMVEQGAFVPSQGDEAGIGRKA